MMRVREASDTPSTAIRARRAVSAA
jgi:hypothetical protein